MLEELMDEELGSTEALSYAKDTELPKSLAKHLAARAEQRRRVIETTEKVSLFFVSWSLNATGFFIARWLLFVGGGINFWLAVSLCFSISSVSSLVGLSGLRVNYQEGLEVENMQSVFRTAGGLIVSTGVTYLAVKDYQYYADLTYQTAAQLSEDIRTVEGQNPELSPWLSIVIGLFILVCSLKVVFSPRR